jgi:hypothetical protein
MKIRTIPSIKAIDEANSLLSVQVDAVRTLNTSPLVLVIGGRVFGYSDAPISREPAVDDGTTLSVVLPTSFLISNPVVIVKPLMADDRSCTYGGFCDQKTLFEPSAELERLVLLEQGSSKIKYLLFGRQLDHLSIVQPQEPTPAQAPADERRTPEMRPGQRAKSAPPPAPKIDLTDIGSDEDKKTLRVLSVDADLAKTLKQIVFKRDNERPFLVAVPALPAADQPNQGPRFQERVTVGADEAVIIGDDIAKVTKVIFQKTELDKTMDGKTLKVKGLVAAGVTSTAKTQSIDLVTTTGKTTIKLEVVNSKVESVQK